MGSFRYLLLAALSFPHFASGEVASSTSWLVGTWQKTLDEDGSPADALTFKPDGTWIAYGPQCQQAIYHYFLHEGDVFLVLPQSKGPVALVFHPNTGKTTLTFTSPRTKNNAIYEKVAHPICGAGES